MNKGTNLNKGTKYRWLKWSLLLQLIVATPVLAQTHLSGQVGADLGSFNFRNHIFNEDFKFNSDRRLANEFLDLRLNGPISNGYFANYEGSVRIRTTQVRSETNGQSVAHYLNPEISNYRGSLSLFPNRTFPLTFYRGKSEENNVRYEVGNRSVIDLTDPGLAVVRRYSTVNEEMGAQLNWTASSKLKIGLEAKTTANLSSRQYDFDENRNIWAEFNSISPGVAPDYKIEIVNTIADRDVLVFVDFAFADTVKAGSTLNLIIEEGTRDIDFAPVGLNTYSNRVTINSDMQWKIFFVEPSGSKDMDRSNDVIIGTIKYGEDQDKFKSEAYLEYNDGYEEVQNMTTNLQTFNNLASYELSPNASINSTTTYSSNQTDIGVLSHQLANMFMQQTTGKWSKRRGISTMVSHSYSNMSSETGASLITSSNNIFMGNVSVPTHWHKHKASLRLMGNFLSDSSGFANDMLSAELGNSLEIKKAGFTWRPKHTLKSTVGTSINPDSSNDEQESKFGLEAEHPGLWRLGKIRFTGHYDWRSKGSDNGTDTKNRYAAELGLTKKMGKNYKLMVSGSIDKEAFKLIAAETDLDVRQRGDETRQSFRVDFQASPSEAFELGANGMWTTTSTAAVEIGAPGAAGATITKYSVSLRVIMPVIHLPLRTFLIKESREMEGLAPQSLLQIETKLSYNFRKISLVLSHRLTDETLTSENYVYNEFMGKISRNFDIF